MGISRGELLVLGATTVVGLGIGFAFEGNTNEVAEGKILTAEACIEIVPHESTITEELEACLEDGVDGGRAIGDDHFDVGDPVATIDTYVQAQKNEARTMEPQRLIGWTVGFFAIGGANWIRDGIGDYVQEDGTEELPVKPKQPPIE